MKVSKTVSKITKTTKTVKTASVKSKRVIYEESVDHVIAPKITNGIVELPDEFIAYHKPHFIKGIQHILKVDPSLYKPIVSSNFEKFKDTTDSSIKSQIIQEVDEKELIRSYWLSLISSVISQQISGSAAASIYGRFEKMFEKEPNPKELLTKSTEQLREIGLSSMKVKYVYDISEKFSDPECPLTDIDFYKNDLEVIVEELCKLKGVGVWSAEMFALFTLKEWDVFSESDLGIARGASYYLSKRPHLIKEIKAEVTKDSKSDENLLKLLKKKGKFEKPSSKRDWIPYHDQHLIYLSKRFQPYRSILMLILWRLSSTNIQALEKSKSEAA